MLHVAYCPQALLFGVTVTTDAVQVGFVLVQHICDVQPAPSMGYLWVKAIVTFLVPVSVLTYAYARIVWVARLHSRKIDVVSLHSRRGSEDSRRPEVSTNGAVAAGAMFSVRRLSVLSLPSQTEGGKQRFHVSGDLELLGATSPSAAAAASVPDAIPPPQSMLCISFRLVLLIVVFFVCCGCRACAVLYEAVAARLAAGERPDHVKLSLVHVAGGASSWNYVMTSQSSHAATDYNYVIVPDTVATASQWLLLLNSMLNPFLYAIMSQRFRFFACSLFCRRLGGGGHYSAQTNGNIFNVSLYSAFLRNLQAPASRRSSVDSCDCVHQLHYLRHSSHDGQQRRSEGDADSRTSRSLAASRSFSSLSSREQSEPPAQAQFLQVPSVFVNTGVKELTPPVEVPTSGVGMTLNSRSYSAPVCALGVPCSHGFREAATSSTPRRAGSMPGSPDDDFYYSRNNKARIRIVLDLV